MFRLSQNKPIQSFKRPTSLQYTKKYVVDMLMSMYFQTVNVILMFSFSSDMSKKYTKKPQNQVVKGISKEDLSKEGLNH